jgi:hypothetical protein
MRVLQIKIILKISRKAHLPPKEDLGLIKTLLILFKMIVAIVKKWLKERNKI